MSGRSPVRAELGLLRLELHRLRLDAQRHPCRTSATPHSQC